MFHSHHISTQWRYLIVNTLNLVLSEEEITAWLLAESVESKTSWMAAIKSQISEILNKGNTITLQNGNGATVVKNATGKDVGAGIYQSLLILYQRHVLPLHHRLLRP